MTRLAALTMLMCALGASGCGPPDPFTAEILSFEPVDDAHIRIDARFENNSAPAGRVLCHITLKESESYVDGDEIRSKGSLGSGDGEVSTSEIRIEIAPEDVNEIDVDHCTATE